MPRSTLTGRVRPWSLPSALLAVLACVVVPAWSAAAAQQLGATRVATVTATIYARCDPASPARAVLERGDTVSIDSVNEGWVLVHVTGGEQGCMRRTDLEPTPAIDRAAEARRAREIAQARGTAPSHATPSTIADRAIVSVNASYLTA